MHEIGKQLKKGVLEILLLSLLSRESMYGYRLIQELDRDSGGAFKMKEGTLYPVLYRLEDNGLIESYWERETEKRGVPRKYYRITNEGTAEMAAMIEEFEVLVAGVYSVLHKGGREY